MSRLLLAFVCFFRVLFGKKLPPAAIAFLPEGTAAESHASAATAGKSIEKPAPRSEVARPAGTGKDAASKEVAAKDVAASKEVAAKDVAAKDVAAKDVRAEPEKPRVSTAQHHRDGALALLALLQREGRLVDFLREPLDGFSDADIGAAARDVHRGCRKVLDQHLSLEPVMPGAEEAKVAVPKGFDPAEIRLIGEAKGEPPFRGTLRHHGWRVVDAKLPALADGIDRMVIAPAEVEL
jgi:hypothetical protein